MEGNFLISAPLRKSKVGAHAKIVQCGARDVSKSLLKLKKKTLDAQNTGAIEILKAQYVLTIHLN